MAPPNSLTLMQSSVPPHVTRLDREPRGTDSIAPRGHYRAGPNVTVPLQYYTSPDRQSLTDSLAVNTMTTQHIRTSLQPDIVHTFIYLHICSMFKLSYVSLYHLNLNNKASFIVGPFGLAEMIFF